MNLTVLTGRLYNGAVHGWQDNEEQERVCFRGRLNFRLQNGDYEWIDVVCFKDNPNTDANGLVGWLEENYLDSDGEDVGHGRAVELTGSLKPTTKKKTITVPIKGGGKKEIPGVPYETFELLIDTASFVPTSQGEGGGRGNRNNIDAEEDFEIDEDADDQDLIEEDDERDQPRRGSSTGRGNSSSTGRGNSGSRNGGRSGSSNRNSGNRSGSTGRGNSGGGSRSDRRSGGSSSKSRSTGNGKSGGSGKGKGKDDDFFVE